MARLKSWRWLFPALTLTAFWLPTLGPLIRTGWTPCSFDGVLHLLRAVHLETLIHLGLVQMSAPK